jgi:hypothetical protein
MGEPGFLSQCLAGVRELTVQQGCQKVSGKHQPLAITLGQALLEQELRPLLEDCEESHSNPVTACDLTDTPARVPASGSLSWARDAKMNALGP